MTIQLTTAAHCLAQLRARNAVKDHIRAHGHKVSAYSARDISVWASLYLEDHHEALIPQAIESAQRMIASGALGKRAQRALCANLTTNAQKQSEPKSTTSALQISGAK